MAFDIMSLLNVVLEAMGGINTLTFLEGLAQTLGPVLSWAVTFLPMFMVVI
jgi:hypothetical protein